jgi:hypothetical protein
VLMHAVADHLGTLRGETPPSTLYDPRTARAADRAAESGAEEQDGEEDR